MDAPYAQECNAPCILRALPVVRCQNLQGTTGQRLVGSPLHAPVLVARVPRVVLVLPACPPPKLLQRQKPPTGLV